jgi:hypothetical protein
MVEPYKTYPEFVAAIYRAWQVQRATSYKLAGWWPKDVEKTAKFMPILPGWEPHEPKFTWVDPKLANIIARQVKGDDGSEDWEVFLIDWEYCAWYPAWLQGLQIKQRSNVLIRDPTTRLGFTFYRKSEISSIIRKNFDPNIN